MSAGIRAEGRGRCTSGFNYLVVDGLANGTEYAFSVTAVYADGRRSDSVSVKAVPHVGPWPEEGVNGTYINNGIVQLGVDMDRGGAVFHFSEVNTKRNLLNHADEGRFIQQSYYGEADGADWNGQSWVWNPIQGGDVAERKPGLFLRRLPRTVFASSRRPFIGRPARP